MTTRVSMARGALFPDPGPARDWLRQELARQEYRESLLERFSRWFDELLASASSAGGAGGLTPALALVLLALLAAGIAVALSRLRSNPAVRAGDSPVFEQARLTASEHRRRASDALGREQWGEAVVEAVRALSAGFVERGLMPEHTGVTVHEISNRAAALFPAHRQRLDAMSLVFDATRYGARPAGEQQAREAVGLELELARGIPDRDPVRAPVSAVPR